MGIFSRHLETIPDGPGLPAPKPPVRPEPSTPSEAVTGDVEADVESLAMSWRRPAILFEPSMPGPAAQSGQSWMGGLPTLPTDMAWPLATIAGGTPVGSPLHFVAQIDCTELPPTAAAANAIPITGTLWFFADLFGDPRNFDVRYSTVEPERFEQRTPPAEIPPVYGCDDYAYLLSTLAVDYSELSLSTTLPRTVLRPVAFDSIPHYLHLRDHLRVFVEPESWRIDPEGAAIQRALDSIEQLRAEAIASALAIDPAEQWSGYEAFVLAPTMVATDDGLPLDFVTVRYAAIMADTAARRARFSQLSDAERLACTAMAAGYGAIATGVADTWEPATSTLMHLLGVLNASPHAPAVWGMQGRATLFDRIERDLDRAIFRSRVADRALPESVQRQVARSSAAVRIKQRVGLASTEPLEITGLIQMGGFCDGSQHRPYTSDESTVLLSVGWLPSLGFAIGDGGDLYYEAPTVDVARGRMDRHQAFFQCH